MRFDSTRFSAAAKSTGFDAANLEKVLRLRELLNEFHKHSFLRGKLVLKGGTALNLFYLGLARLSVDIDLNYIANIGRDEMLAERVDIVKAVDQITTGLGYKLQNLSPPQKNQPQHGLCWSGCRCQGSRRRYLAGQLYGVRSRLHRSGGKNSAAPRKPFWPKSVTYVSGTICHLCLRAGP